MCAVDSKKANSTEKAATQAPGLLDPVFGKDYNVIEVRFTILAAILIALNNGFVNGVTLSGLLSEAEKNPSLLNPDTAMVSGVAGYITQNARSLVANVTIDEKFDNEDEQWDFYQYNLFMFISYMFGAFITAVLSPRAKPYSVDPMFGPAFLIGGTMLLFSSILSARERPTHYIYCLAICANGVQNGVASIYSANLIRCTLTGAVTDIGLVIGQMLRGNYAKVGKGCVLALIVTCFWIGGLISYNAVQELEKQTLFINAGIFYVVGALNIVYLVGHLRLSFFDAVTGKWSWKDVLNKITPSGDRDELLALFDEMDRDESGTLDMYELEKGLKGKVTSEELKALLLAADHDGDGEISKHEWEELVNQLFIVDASSARRSSIFYRPPLEKQNSAIFEHDDEYSERMESSERIKN